MGGWTSDSASGQVVAFLVAGSVFTVAMAGVLYQSNSGPLDTSTAQRGSLDRQAASLMDALAGPAGPAAETGVPLALGDGDGGLDAARLDLLRGGMEDATSNGRVDYAEALAAFNVDPREMGFHLRVEPIGNLEPDLGRVKPLYVGHYPSSPTVSPVMVGPPGSVVAQFQIYYKPEAGVAEEIALLSQLGLDFDPKLDLNTTSLNHMVVGYEPLVDTHLVDYVAQEEPGLLSGDVLMDKPAYLESVLPERLWQSDLLFVGSTVDHAALAVGDLPEQIRDWTLAGGTVVVLGSSQVSPDWLHPLWAAGKQTVNQAPQEPDPDHPILNHPNLLLWSAFDGANNKNMLYTPEAWSYHDHVLLRFGTASKLAVSRDGAFGDGRVVISSYVPPYLVPHDFRAESEPRSSEPLHFMENVVTFAVARDLYLDYGLPPPDGTPVAAQQRTFPVQTLYGTLPVQVTLLTWST